MLDSDLTLRLAGPSDLAGVDGLLARSYPRLLAPDYAPSMQAMAFPIISRARPELLASGRYYVVEDEAGQLRGAGGWSTDAPRPVALAGQAAGGLAHVRHVATDPDATRRGIGRAIMSKVMLAARDAGARQLDCLSTLTAVPFYGALGFRVVGPVTVTLAPGVLFPAVRMVRLL